MPGLEIQPDLFKAGICEFTDSGFLIRASLPVSISRTGTEL